MKSITVYNTENRPFEIVGQRLSQTFSSADRLQGYANDGIYQQINLVQLQDSLSGVRKRYGIRLMFPGRPDNNFPILVMKSPKGRWLNIGCQRFIGKNAETILNAAATVAAAAKAARKKAKSN